MTMVGPVRTDEVQLITKAEAAQLCGVTKSAITYLLIRNRINRYVVDGRELVNYHEVYRALRMSLADYARQENQYLITAPEAEKDYFISKMTILRWANRGVLTKHYIGNSKSYYMVDSRELEAVLDKTDWYYT